MADAKQVVLVTGSSTGFGKLIAEALARKGYRVFATMRNIAGKNAKAAQEVKELAEKEKIAIEAVEMDVTDDASVQRGVDEVIRRAGRIDVVVNNAGYAPVGLLEAMPVDQVQRLFNTNVFGALRVNRAVLPQMHKQHSGLLIAVSSGAGRLIFPGYVAYCASKFAMEAFTEGARYELGIAGIDSVSLQPGAYPTPIFSKTEYARDAARADAYGPMKEVPGQIEKILASSTANPQEIADAVLVIIETPAGQRETRYRVGTGVTGVENVNAASKEAQKTLFEKFGLSEVTAFRKSSGASA